MTTFLQGSIDPSDYLVFLEIFLLISSQPYGNVAPLLSSVLYYSVAVYRRAKMFSLVLLCRSIRSSFPVADFFQNSLSIGVSFPLHF